MKKDRGVKYGSGQPYLQISYIFHILDNPSQDYRYYEYEILIKGSEYDS